MRSDHSDSSSHIAFKDGTSSGSAQPIVETTAPSDSLASLMANWVVVVPSQLSLSPPDAVGDTPQRAI